MPNITTTAHLISAKMYNKKLSNAKARRLRARKPRARPGVKRSSINNPGYMTGVNVNSGVPSISRVDVPIVVQDHQVIDGLVTVADASFAASSSLLLCPALFARLQVLSQVYDLVRLDSLSVKFVPMYGTSVPGMVSMYFDYNDVSVPANVTLANSLLATGCVSGPIYRPLTLRWLPQDHGDVEFGSSSSAMTFRSDNKLTGFHIAVQLPSSAPADYGLIYLSYHVTLKSLKVSATTAGLTLTVDTSTTDRAATVVAPLSISTEHMSDTIQSLLLPK